MDILGFGVQVMLIGLVVVFVGLILLILCVKIMDKLVNKSEEGKPAAPAPAPAPAPKPAAPAGAETINSPMPGTILAVNVQPGAAVKRGQVLLILEAMKMENEIMCPRDGVVASVMVTKGSAVNSGDPLVALN